MNETDETIIYQGRPSWLNYYLLYVIGIVLFIFFANTGEIGKGLFVLLMIWGLAALFRYRYLFIVTEDRVVSRVGLIARNTNEMRVKHIRSLMVRQNSLERLLGIGTLIIASAAEGEAAVVFKGIRDPHGVKEMIWSTQG
jgi:uncharacterized membrane protein YdbT with pleckstrin-like domain